LHVAIEVVAIRPSKSRQERGIVKLKVTTLNQTGEALQNYVGNLVVLRRRTQV
jgi:acyl dehydratase